MTFPFNLLHAVLVKAQCSGFLEIKLGLINLKQIYFNLLKV